MEWWMLYIILAIVLGVLVSGYLILKNKLGKRMSAQQELVEQHKITTTILILEKRIDKIENAKVPKEIIDQMPKLYKYKKIPIVKAKIGAHVMDLLCEKDVYEKLPDKKSIKVDMAGIYIVAISKGTSATKGRR